MNGELEIKKKCNFFHAYFFRFTLQRFLSPVVSYGILCTKSNIVIRSYVRAARIYAKTID